MLKAFFEWLFGRRRAPQPATSPAVVPASRISRPVAETDTRANALSTPSGEPLVAYLCREAVLSRDQGIAGYHFMLHEGTLSRIRSGSWELHHAYSEVLVRNLARANIGQLLGNRLAFIELPDAFLSHASLDELPAKNFVLIPVPQAEGTAQTTTALTEAATRLRKAGFRIGLPDPLSTPAVLPLLPIADVVVVSAPMLDPARGLQLSQLLTASAPQASLLVRDLPSLEDFRFAFKMGASLFQGPFITSREDWTEQDLGASTMRIATLLGRLRQSGDTREIANLLKQDGALSLRVLRYVNSAANAQAESITSIEHALALLGHERLYRWLVLLACGTDGNNGRASAALETALVRARMMELLAANQPPIQRESLFLVGLLSLADVIMRVPLDKVLTPLALAPEVTSALQGNDGPLYPLLELAIACEGGEGGQERIQQVSQRCGVTAEQASNCHIQALSWAMEVQQ